MRKFRRKQKHSGGSADWLVACKAKCEFSPITRESDMFVESVHLFENRWLGIARNLCDQNNCGLAKES